MPRHSSWFFLVVSILFGCSATITTSDIEVQAQRHMALADTLERASELEEATLEYQIVAERFPSTSVHSTAVRKTALLLSAPNNPAANDSAAHHWLNTYLNLTQSPEEKQIIQMYLKTVDRVKTLRDSIARQAAISDSLASVTRKQASEVSSRSKRIQDLEAELQKASNELRRLKEVDVRLSKRRERNRP
ncbi:MAG: hypothetical protein AAB393_07285 [Bacteroidota bacterium]